MHVRGVVLAGGDSTRFEGGDKALATLDGRPLVAHVVDAVAEATDRPPLLAVATEPEGRRLAGAVDGAVEVVVDDPGRAGPLAGLFAAAETVDAPWLVVCGCDMPLVTAASVAELLATVEGVADPDGDDALPAAVVPVVDGHAQPLHVCYRREAVLAAGEAVPDDAGPMALLDALDPVRRVPATAFDAAIERAVTNANTRGDLRRIADDT